MDDIQHFCALALARKSRITQEAIELPALQPVQKNSFPWVWRQHDETENDRLCVYCFAWVGAFSNRTGRSRHDYRCDPKPIRSRRSKRHYNPHKCGYGAGVESEIGPVSYTHLRAHETGRNLVCRL